MSKLTFKDRLLNFYRTRPLTVFSALVVLAGAGAILGVMLLVSIFEHKQEAKNPFFRVVELNDEIDDPAVWGKNFPLSVSELCSSSPFSSRLFFLRSTFIHALLISEKIKPTQHHAIRNHQHGGNHGSPAEGHCRLHSHHQRRGAEGTRRTTLPAYGSPVAGKILRLHYRERWRH